MKPKLESEGFVVFPLDFAPGWGKFNGIGDIKIYAGRISDFISLVKKLTGAEKVDIIAHSMGGLISRWYLEKADGSKNVDQLIMLGTPNHGSELCYLLDDTIGLISDPDVRDTVRLILLLYRINPFSKPGDAIFQMTPNSPFLKSLGYSGHEGYHIIIGNEPHDAQLKVTSTYMEMKPDCFSWCQNGNDGAVKYLSAKLENIPSPSLYPVDHFEEPKDDRTIAEVISVL
jgi:pimeloyl-ACP methyl ester carboxylesterase